MNQEQEWQFGGRSEARSREVFLWLGCFFSVFSLAELASGEGFADGCRWLCGPKHLLLDLCLLFCIASSIAVVTVAKPAGRNSKASLFLGWTHTCALAYMSLCSVLLSRFLFRLAIFGPDRGLSPVATVQPVFESLTRAILLYFVAGAVTVLMLSRKWPLSPPPYGIVLLAYFVLWLALNMGIGAWR